MGVLMPLYLAGLAALSLPLLFHLIRRTPRGRQTFSSLMFLAPSPPRLTRRSRLDHLLLLLLRAAALALLALAFARPFLREATLLSLDGREARRVAILVDTSASMRRGDLWQQAVRQVDNVLNELGPHDDAALLTFHEQVKTIVGFERGVDEPSQNKRGLIREQMRALQPTWHATDLGTALVSVASELDLDERDGSQGEPQIVLIGDLIQGGRIEALQTYAWPERVPLVVHRLALSQPTNAFAHLLLDEEQSEPSEPRVRVANAADSTTEQFTLEWASASNASGHRSLPVYVPPGQSRVVRLARPEGERQVDRIVLRGDDCDFDNSFYVAPPQRQDVIIAYLDDEGEEDQLGLLYFLRAALADDPWRSVQVNARRSDQAPQLLAAPRPQLTVVAGQIGQPLRETLMAYLAAGGTLLGVPPDRESAAALAMLGGAGSGDPRTTGDASSVRASHGSYLMLGEIDFAHPLFVSFASPRYNDFTKIHFWRHRPLNINPSEEVRIVARFDNGDPAIVERLIGPGRLVLFTSGWHPADSQLALSSKFVPLMQSLLDVACGNSTASATLTVGQKVPLPTELHSRPLTVQRPDTTQVRLPSGTEVFDNVDQPGIYRLTSGDESFVFAANVSLAESNTAPLDLEQLEQAGVRIGSELTRAERVERLRQQRDTELESRQKVWRWLIIAALGLLIVETGVAGRAARQIGRTAESA